jgi:hypothetical protein
MKTSANPLQQIYCKESKILSFICKHISREGVETIKNFVNKAFPLWFQPNFSDTLLTGIRNMMSKIRTQITFGGFKVRKEWSRGS